MCPRSIDVISLEERNFCGNIEVSPRKRKKSIRRTDTIWQCVSTLLGVHYSPNSQRTSNAVRTSVTLLTTLVTHLFVLTTRHLYVIRLYIHLRPNGIYLLTTSGFYEESGSAPKICCYPFRSCYSVEQTLTIYV